MTGFSIRPPRPSRRVLRAIVRLRRATDGVAAVEFALLLPLMLLLYLGSAETMQAVIAGRKASIVAKTMADLVAQTSVTGSGSTASGMTDTTMGAIFNGAQVMMQPFATTGLKLTVSMVSFEPFTADPTTVSGQPHVAYANVWIPGLSAVASSSHPPTAANPGYAAKVRWSVNPGTSGVASNTTLSGVSAAVTRSCATQTPAATVGSLTAGSMPEGLYGATSLVVSDVQYVYTPTFGASLSQIGSFAGWNPSSTAFTSQETQYEQPRTTVPKCSANSSPDTWICYSAQTPTTSGGCDTSTY